MRLTCGNRQSSGREFVLLAPSEGGTRQQFGQTSYDSTRHRRLLAGAQRLRAKVYVDDGALEPRQLSRDGRHIQASDALSWHLLAVDERERVVACLRYLAHGPEVSFSDLAVSHSALAKCSQYGPLVRQAVEGEIRNATMRGLSYVEIGGWAISEELRCTSEAFRMLLSVYALGQMTGGALGVSTATTRHNSSAILKRMGGKPFFASGTEIPPYFDPEYDCEMELLGFDSSSAGDKYAAGIGDCRTALLSVSIVTQELSVSEPGAFLEGLLPLHAALANAQTAAVEVIA